MTLNLEGLPPRAIRLMTQFIEDMVYRETTSIDLTLKDMASAGTNDPVVDQQMKDWAASYTRLRDEMWAARKVHDPRPRRLLS